MTTAQPCTHTLGPLQQIAVDGPSYGPEMFTYICVGCKQKFPDTGLYFNGVSSTKCIWCAKFPKVKSR
jgi:hypothetical protein